MSLQGTKNRRFKKCNVFKKTYLTTEANIHHKKTQYVRSAEVTCTTGSWTRRCEEMNRQGWRQRRNLHGCRDRTPGANFTKVTLRALVKVQHKRKKKNYMAKRKIKQKWDWLHWTNRLSNLDLELIKMQHPPRAMVVFDFYLILLFCTDLNFHYC